MLKNKEIADILKISPAAVSLALNNKYGVSEDTRRKVIALRNSSMAADYNDLQRRELNAPQILFLVLKKHGFVISDTPFFMSLSEALYQRTSIEGYSLRVCYFHPEQDLQAYLDSLNVEQYDGILVLGTEADSQDIATICALNKPAVVLDAWIDDMDIDCVLMDNESGVLQGMKYAYAMGHRRIGFIGSQVRANNFRDRYCAYRAALNRLNLPYRREYVQYIRSTADGACADMQHILENGCEMPSLFVCANDIVAMGVINALTKRGYRVPDDVSIIGFDDMPVSAQFNPPITSVGINIRKIAKTAVETLVERMHEKENASVHVRTLVSVDLKIRSSVAKVAPETVQA